MRLMITVIAALLVGLVSQPASSAEKTDRKADWQKKHWMSFDELDHSGDGKVTLDEWRAAHEKRLAQRFSRIDTDADGMITKKEFKKKRAKHRKMVVVASDTKSNSKAFAKEFPYAVVRDDIPEKFSDFKKKEKNTRLLYIKSQYGHGDLADGGVALPLLLRLTPLKRI